MFTTLIGVVYTVGMMHMHDPPSRSLPHKTESRFSTRILESFLDLNPPHMISTPCTAINLVFSLATFL
jgi:hypothetical protein